MQLSGSCVAETLLEHVQPPCTETKIHLSVHLINNGSSEGGKGVGPLVCASFCMTMCVGECVCVCVFVLYSLSKPTEQRRKMA